MTEPHRGHLRRRHLQRLAAGRMWHRLVEEDRTDERAHRELMAAELAAPAADAVRVHHRADGPADRIGPGGTQWSHSYVWVYLGRR